MANSSSLTVSSVELQDSGAYQCFAANEAGVGSRSTLVTVRSKGLLLIHRNMCSWCYL